MFDRKRVLKNFPKFTGSHLQWRRGSEDTIFHGHHFEIRNIEDFSTISLPIAKEVYVRRQFFYLNIQRSIYTFEFKVTFFEFVFLNNTYIAAVLGCLLIILIFSLI